MIPCHHVQLLPLVLSMRNYTVSKLVVSIYLFKKWFCCKVNDFWMLKQFLLKASFEVSRKPSFEEVASQLYYEVFPSTENENDFPLAISELEHMLDHNSTDLYFRILKAKFEKCVCFICIYIYIYYMSMYIYICIYVFVYLCMCTLQIWAWFANGLRILSHKINKYFIFYFNYIKYAYKMIHQYMCGMY